MMANETCGGLRPGLVRQPKWICSNWGPLTSKEGDSKRVDSLIISLIYSIGIHLNPLVSLYVSLSRLQDMVWSEPSGWWQSELLKGPKFETLRLSPAGVESEVFQKYQKLFPEVRSLASLSFQQQHHHWKWPIYPYHPISTLTHLSNSQHLLNILASHRPGGRPHEQMIHPSEAKLLTWTLRPVWFRMIQE